jgi:hypothetical protein
VHVPSCRQGRLAGRQRRPAATGIRSSGPIVSELPRVSGQVIRGSSHGDGQPSRQATREGAAAAVTMSPPRRPGRTAPLSFGRVLVAATGRRKLSAWIDWGRAPGCPAARARRRPPARTPLTPPSDQNHHADEQNGQVQRIAQDKQRDLCTRGIVLGTPRPRREEHEHLHACIKRRCRRHHRTRPQTWLPVLGPILASSSQVP